MPGNLSKKKGLQSTITNERLDYIAGKLGDTLLNPKIKAFLNLENNYTQTEIYQALKDLIDSLEDQKADSDDIPSKLSQLENDSNFAAQSEVDAVEDRVKALEDMDWSDINLDGYQKKLTFDAAPKEGSSNPVTSKGIHSAMNDLKTSILDEVAADVLQTFDPTSTNAQSGVAIAGELDNYVEKVEGKVLSANDYTDSEKQKNADNATNIALLAQNKVSKVAGKDLSTNDYTDEEKQKNAKNATDIEEINTSLADCVKKTDYASASAAGVVRPGIGLTIDSDGYMHINSATGEDVANRDPGCVLTPHMINTAVKAALTDSNRITGMTESEKANARDVIGAEQKTTIVPWLSTTTTMSVNVPFSTEYTQICDHDITTLSLGVSAAVPVGYECSFTFQSGETATTITYPGDSFKFVGVDCDADGDFVPSANTNYEVSIRNLSTNTANPLLVARVGVY